MIEINSKLVAFILVVVGMVSALIFGLNEYDQQQKHLVLSNYFDYLDHSDAVKSLQNKLLISDSLSEDHIKEAQSLIGPISDAYKDFTLYYIIKEEGGSYLKIKRSYDGSNGEGYMKTDVLPKETVQVIKKLKVADRSDWVEINQSNLSDGYQKRLFYPLYLAEKGSIFLEIQHYQRS